MTNQTYRPIFHPAGPFLCNKPFVMSGVAYALGDPVDVTGVEVRRLRQMYEGRMIEVGASGGPVSAPAAPVPAAQPGRVIAPPVASAAPAATVAPAGGEKPSKGKFPGSNGLSADYRGFGRYFVLDAEGQTISGPLSKVEAFTKAGVPLAAAAAAE